MPFAFADLTIGDAPPIRNQTISRAMVPEYGEFCQADDLAGT
jgi:hypothetical protein